MKNYICIQIDLHFMKYTSIQQFKSLLAILQDCIGNDKLKDMETSTSSSNIAFWFSSLPLYIAFFKLILYKVNDIQ